MIRLKSFLLSSAFLSFLFIINQFSNAEELLLNSPDKKLNVKVSLNNNVSWSLTYDGETLLNECPISLTLSDGSEPGKNIKVQKKETRSIDETTTVLVPVKRKQIKNNCNELEIIFGGGYKIIFRAYDDGAAYRFILNRNSKSLDVLTEQSQFNFAGNYRTLFPEEELSDFVSHYERVYKDTLIGNLPDTAFCSLPVLLKTQTGKSIVISEADLYDYPNMFLKKSDNNSLTAIYPRIILEKESASDRDEEIKKFADHIASINGNASLPWRVVMVAGKDEDLLENDMVYRLSRPSDKDFSWVKPGKVAWDWWNALNIYGVDFRSGINTQTYKYYIDFASKFNLEYIILDEGWSKTTHDLLNPNPDLNFTELFSYAESKNVGIILWVLWNALDNDMDKILDQFVKWGAKGIKVDFMQRADQEMVNYYEKVASKAADRRLLVDFHGAYKPSGLNRKYPNVLSFEGVKGLENNKWSNDITPKHDVILPFTRMAAGPMDFTPGAMINATKENYRAIFSEPISQGTRCHQAAMYVMYESPLQMLSDNPTNYLRDTVYTRFISSIPTTWDETIGLKSEVGEFAAVARKHGNKWYIGAMTNWTPREMEISLSFLGEGIYRLLSVEDGINADKHAADYTMSRGMVRANNKLKIRLSPGGGWAGILSPVD